MLSVQLETDKAESRTTDQIEEVQWLYTDPQGKVQGQYVFKLLVLELGFYCRS